MAAPERFSAAHPGDPQPGDLIEIFRPAYQHWALYLGDGYIINVAPVGKAGTARKSAVLGCFGGDWSPASLSGQGVAWPQLSWQLRDGASVILNPMR